MKYKMNETLRLENESKIEPNVRNVNIVIEKRLRLCACHLQLRCCLASVSPLVCSPRFNAPFFQYSSAQRAGAAHSLHTLPQPVGRGPVWNATGGTLLAPRSYQLQLSTKCLLLQRDEIQRHVSLDEFHPNKSSV